MKEIPLTQGKVAIVDDEFFDALMAMGKWWFCHGYARHSQRIAGRKSSVYMHRIALELAGLPPGQMIDHIDGDRLNNRIANLRSVTMQQNGCNRGRTINNKSGYKGVCWDRRRSKWTAQIHLSGKKLHLGMFTNKIDAAEAYDKAAIQFHGEFARLNFATAA